MTKKIDKLAIFSDKPTKIDLLNFKDYSNLLSNVVANSETPSTIGIFGEWGSGKTSLMLMIEDHLQKKGIKTIWFNAWKYDKEEALWRALILSILRGLSAEQKEIDDTTLKLYEAVSTEKLGQMQIDWLEIGKTLLKGTVSVIAVIAAPLFLLPGFVNAFVSAKFLDQVSNAFTRRKILQSRERISSIEQFEELYQHLISKYIIDHDRIVILIDDLDRCVPIRSLEVLEALKSFLDASGCVYVVACDTRLINHGLLEKYDGKIGINLDEYLAKIVQFSFTIPPIRIEDAEIFIRNFGLSISSDDVNRLISTTIDRNPRKLKRFLSDLKIKSQLVKARGLLIRPNVLVKMSCIAYSWKDFWSASINSSSVIERAQKIALSEDKNEKSDDDVEFSKLFNIDERLYNFLRTQPLISEADIQEYIFLAATTSSPREKTSKDLLYSNEEYFQKYKYIDSAKNLSSFENEKEFSLIFNALKEETQLIMVIGAAGTGKTTLLKRIDVTHFANIVIAYINSKSSSLGSFPTKEFLYEFARLISQQIRDRGYEVRFQPDSSSLTPEGLNIYLKKILSAFKDKRLVIMIDDAEYLNMENILSFNRMLAENKSLTVILSSRIKLISSTQKKWEKISKITIVMQRISPSTFNNMYKRLMSIPMNYFDASEAYNLVYLFENELRILISNKFTEFDWWQQGLSIVDNKRIMTGGKYSLDNFTLGELFKLVMIEKNWRKVFSQIFPSKEYLEQKTPIILSARNAIAHNRALTNNKFNEFAMVVKELLLIIHTINFG